MADFTSLREAMVAEQIERRGVRDRRVLDAMRRVPRERFVDAPTPELAYADQALTIGSGQTISQPYMVAVMTEALDLRGSERVLEIGTGSGYQTAILCALAGHVFSVERHADLAAEARQRLAALGCTNVDLVVGDGSAGYEPAAPYDRILVTAGAPQVPPSLVAQLGERGRLVVPVGTQTHQVLTVVDKRNGATSVNGREECVFVPLVGREGW